MRKKIYRITIPTNVPGGFITKRSGHCDVFTAIEMSIEEEIPEDIAIANEGHDAGGCMARSPYSRPQMLRPYCRSGFRLRSMQGFAWADIIVYHVDHEQLPNVNSVVESLRGK